MSKQELERELAATKEKTKEKLESIARSVQEMKDIGNNTNLELARQGEKLVSINGKLDEIDHDVQYGNYVAEGMKSFWTRLKHKFTGGFKPKPGAPLPSGPEFGDVCTPENKDRKPRHPTPNAQGVGQFYTKEDAQIDSYLDSLCQGIQQLKHIGQLTGMGLDHQSNQIKTINEKTDKVNKNLSRANKNVNYLLNS